MSSQDADGFYEMDELEDLLQEETFDKDSNSEDASEVIFHQGAYHLSYKHRRHLQSLPTNSLVRQIAKSLEDEGVPLPHYLFWPWTKIRTCFTGLLLVSWIAVTLATFLPIIQMSIFPEICVGNKWSKQWWSAGPLFILDHKPRSSLSFLVENIKILKEYDVKTIQLSSPAWWMNIHDASMTDTSMTDTLQTMQSISSLCHAQGLKLILSVSAQHFSQISGSHTGSVIQDSAKLKNIFQLFIDKGVSGFYFPENVKMDFKLPDDQSNKDILFGTNFKYNSTLTYPAIGLRYISLNMKESVSAKELNKWIEVHVRKTKGTVLWNVSRLIEDEITQNLRHLSIILPGIPMLDAIDFNHLNSSSESHDSLKLLLKLRKTSPSLQEAEFSLLNEYDHVFALLRIYREEKRYLILWNLSQLKISLNYHQLSMEGRWVYRSVEPYNSHNVVKMRHIDNIQAREFGVIELPG